MAPRSCPRSVFRKSVYRFCGGTARKLLIERIFGHVPATDDQAFAAFCLNAPILVSGGSFQVRRVGTGFAAPVFIAAMPGDGGRMLVVERGGRIRMLDPQGNEVADGERPVRV
mgnify:CR=1 FL=1